MKFKHLFITTLLSVSFLSCEDILDCVIGRSASLPNKSFQVGIENIFYSDYISAEVKNDPDDENYDYYFDLYGDLPEGLDYYVDNRLLIIEGVPTESGYFEFTVHLMVDGPIYYDYEDDTYHDPLCSESDSMTYGIVIE